MEIYSLFTIIILTIIATLVLVYSFIAVRGDWTDSVLGAIMLLVVGVIAVDQVQAADYDLFYSPGVYHYDRSHGYNEENHILAVRRHNWSIGHFTNSFDDESWMIAHHKPLNSWAEFTVLGATGYDDSPITPMIGFNLHYSCFWAQVTPVYSLIGLRIPLGGE